MSNRLSQEKSPYLRQHANNPVDWYPWGEEALRRAREEQKPLFVSIGYATCHWCHVMERESFEDPAIADLLNKDFIALKIDREERPDLDRVFMSALHAMGRQGGWPLNLFATPEGKPFYGGTYFPPKDLYGRRAFSDILQALARAWQEQREELLESADELVERLRAGQSGPEKILPLSLEVVDTACEQLLRSFDLTWGGLNHNLPNKFPLSMSLPLLLRYARRKGEATALERARLTLEKMLQGGIYDQIGGGIHRYSTDPEWRVPHFEKMLYDNALFVSALVETWQVTGWEEFRQAAQATLEYLSRDLSHPEGGFYSAEDADSAGAEGLFYLWRLEELEQILPPRQAALACRVWQVSKEGNYEGATILTRSLGDRAMARGLGLTQEEFAQEFASIKSLLLAARAKRPRPLRDEKILTAWNGLAISAFAQAAMAFDSEAYAQRARRAGEFVVAHCLDAGGRLYRRYMEGERGAPAFLADYAQLGLACLDLFIVNWDLAWLQRAVKLAEETHRLFAADLGYYDTAKDQSGVLVRTQEAYDGVEPAGNSAAAMLWARLAAWGFADCAERADRIFQRFSLELSQQGAGLTVMLAAFERWQTQRQLVILGDEKKEMLRLVRQGYHPDLALLWVPLGQEVAFAQTIPLAAEKEALGGPTAWLCEDFTCQAPLTGLEALKAAWNP